MIRSIRATAVVAFLTTLSLSPLAAQTDYRTPPAPIAEILSPPPLPIGSTSPDGRLLLLQEPATMPPIAELAAPMLRLAGMRINPATNGPAGSGSALTGYRLRSLADGREVVVQTPEGSLGAARWSPDSRWLAFTSTRDDQVEQWVASTGSGQARRVASAVNEAAGGCQWMPDSQSLLCLLVPADRGAPPVEPRVPGGPTVQESRGREAPVRTYQDLLRNAHDEALFEHYMTAQPAFIDVASGRATAVGSPAVYRDVSPSPDGRYLLVQRVRTPWSYLVPVWGFPLTIELWNDRGETVRQIADLPLADAIPIGGVRTGPRSLQWRALHPATLVWVEALDDGDPRTKVEYRDRVLRLDAPFVGQPAELARTGERFAGLTRGEGDVALLSDFDRRQRWQRTWVVHPDQPGAKPRLLWDRSTEDAYNDPGRPELRLTESGDRVLLQDGDWIYLTGAGASPRGDRPFLDRLNLETFETERIWRSDPGAYETVVSVLDHAASRILTRHESAAQPPNYFVLDLASRERSAITDFDDPAPQLRGIQRQLVVYERADGVPLNGTLYLPADYRDGDRLPVVLWAYPREFVSADAAGQVRASDNRFTTITGPSHLFFLTQGYAGAFMTANLLAHSDLFSAGIARSGAYNRTLTPFGFQNERRTFWDAPEVYSAMSPFMHAHLRTTSYELRATSYELRTTSYELRVTNYELRTTNCGAASNNECSRAWRVCDGFRSHPNLP